jgi:prepilin-type processing-associated H-X9-DG protein
MWGGNYPAQVSHALLAVHNGGSNYLFADFHVEWLSKEEMQNDPNDYTWYTKP